MQKPLPDPQKNDTNSHVSTSAIIKFSIGFATTGLVAIAPPTFAQIVPDNTLGAEGSRLTPNVQIRGALGDRIDGGALRGVNLFHSFEQFNINDLQRVYFANPAGIENILSRVTGDDVSDIFGTLGVDGNANLFLLNPNGIIFGENARLDIAGSFVASGGDRFTFPDGSEFSATNPQAPPLLTVNVPIGIQSGAQLQGNLINQGQLSVGDGQILSLMGQTVLHQGQVTASGGVVQLLGDRVALLDMAKVDVSSDMGGGAVYIGGDYQGLGNLPTAQQTYVAPTAVISASSGVRGDGGRVIIWSDETTRFYGSVDARGGELAGDGGFVEISSKETLDFNGYVDTSAPFGVPGVLLLDPTNIEVVDFFEAETFDLADVDDAGDLDLGLDGDTRIAADAINFAPANVTLRATNNVDVNAIVQIFSPGVGLTIEAGNDITLNEFIATLGEPVRLDAGGDIRIIGFNGNVFSNGGNVSLFAAGNILLDGSVVDTSDIFGGDSGEILVNTGSLTLRNGGQLISNTAFAGESNAGDITITATDAVSIIGQSGILSSVNAGAMGTGGDIRVQARSLSLSEGGQIQTILFRGDPGGQGRAGNIEISTVDSVTITGTNPIGGFSSGLLASSEQGSTGPAGNIDVTIQNGTFRVADGAIVNTESQNADAGGIITLNSPVVELLNGGQLLALTNNAGNAGSVTVNASERITVAGRDPGFFLRLLSFGPDLVRNLGEESLISPNAILGSTGNAGNVFLSTAVLEVIDSGRILVSTDGGGLPGNITIQATDVVELRNQGSLSTFANQQSNPGLGNLEIQTGTLIVADQSLASVATFGDGDAGNLTIRAEDAVILRGSAGLSADVDALASGNGGLIRIETGQLVVEDEAAITVSTLGLGGNAGTIDIQVESITLDTGGVLTARVDEGATGRGGDILIDTINFVAREGGGISTSTSSSGDAGRLNLQAAESVVVASNSGLLSQVNPGASGDAGEMVISTRQLSLQDGGIISAVTLGTGQGGQVEILANEVEVLGEANFNSGIVTDTTGPGSAGDLLLFTDDLTVQNSVISTATSGTGDAGDLRIQPLTPGAIATNTLTVSGVGGIETSSAIGNSGPAGDLSITTGRLTVTGGAQIGAGTFGSGQAGQLTIFAADAILVSGMGTGLFTQTQGSGNAQDLTIETPRMEVRDGAQVSAGTFASGQAGGLTVSLTDSLVLTGQNSSLITQTDGSGNGGDLVVTVPELSLTEGARISAATSNTGQPGNIRITQAEAIALSGDSQISTEIRAGAIVDTLPGSSVGDIFLATGRLNINDGAEITASTSGQGDAGSVTVFGEEAIALTDGQISTAVNAGAIGQGGDITVETPNLQLEARAQISAQTAGEGNAGDITIIATDRFDAIQGSQILAATVGEGNAGSLQITTPRFSLRDGAEVAVSSTEGNAAGSLTLRATDAVLDGQAVISAETESGSGGDVQLHVADQLMLRGGSRISASTQDGQGGRLTLNLDSAATNAVTLRNGSRIATEATNTGSAGVLQLNAALLTLRNNAEISAATVSGAGGGIRLDGLDSLQLEGSQISASTQTGQAGSITIAASEAITLDGGSEIAVEARSPANNFITPRQTQITGGTAGSLTIRTPALFAQNESRLTVSSPDGQAGNLTLFTNRLQLDDSSLTAETGVSGSADGAVISLSGVELLFLDNASLISAQAFADANGGNVTIVAGDGFLVAPPLVDSDIIARAERGDGGNINITAQSIIGLEERPAIPGNGTNDIDASSQFGAPGTVLLNEPDVEPERGTFELPSNLVDASQLVAQVCPTGPGASDRLGNFSVTGRGGLPPGVSEILGVEDLLLDWVTPPGEGAAPASSPGDQSRALEGNAPIVEAQGWQIDAQGKVVLVADTVAAQGRRPGENGRAGGLCQPSVP
ncbi:MAG: filamentous hemagglutinin N-terminal domain-containing protein [Synechococcales bacterium]|nr:filamentous hemagglutinin N-terminal domain-containing protein [Synechococcales bacterium]